MTVKIIIKTKKRCDALLLNSPITINRFKINFEQIRPIIPVSDTILPNVLNIKYINSSKGRSCENIYFSLQTFLIS